MSPTDRAAQNHVEDKQLTVGGRMFIFAHGIVGYTYRFSLFDSVHTHSAANNRAVSKKFLNRDSKIEKRIVLFRSSGNAPHV